VYILFNEKIAEKKENLQTGELEQMNCVMEVRQK